MHSSHHFSVRCFGPEARGPCHKDFSLWFATLDLMLLCPWTGISVFLKWLLKPTLLQLHDAVTLLIEPASKSYFPCVSTTKRQKKKHKRKRKKKKKKKLRMTEQKTKKKQEGACARVYSGVICERMVCFNCCWP
jgi:hypothetical protein